MIRIAFLAPSLHRGGAERQMLYLASNLPRDSFDVRFILMSERGPLADEAERLGIPLYELGMDRDRCRGLDPRCLGSLAGSLRAYRSLIRRVDIVDAWTVPAYTFAGLVRPLANVPVLMAGRRSLPDVARTRTRARELARTLAMRHIDAVVSNSEAAARAAVSVEHIPPSRVHVVPNAVDVPAPSAEQRSMLRETWGVRSDDLVIGCVATMRPGKGHELLLDVASDLIATHPRVRFVLVGDGPMRATVEERVRAGGLDGVVTIVADGTDARVMYQAFDIVVQASETEGLPNVVLEAAASGKAIVATDVGGTSEVVTSGENGILVPRKDGSAMREAIATLIEDPELRSRYGRAASERAQAFSVEALADRMSALYRRLLDQATPSSVRTDASSQPG